MIPRSVLAATAIAAFPALLHATTCSVPPPCGRVSPGAVIFVGLVVDADPPDDSKDAKLRSARVRIQEVFQGLPSGTEEVFVFTQGSWLKKGATYLIDAYKRNDGLLEPGLCGATSEIDSSGARDLVEYLRNRKAGKATTSLHVQVSDSHEPVPDVEVTIAGPKKSFMAKTNQDGIASFQNVEPGQHRVRASREFYRLDPERDNELTVEIAYGGCPSTFLSMQAQGEVSGLVRDEQGTPVGALPVELLEIPADSKSLSGSGGWFHSKTDDKGNFRFESVSPGRYYLGTNLAGFSKAAPVPRIFYPGRREPAGAIPIEVKLGGTVENLFFTIPYYGKPREIRLLVVDEAGRPVKGARLINKTDEKDWDIGALAAQSQTDDKGTLVATGFEGVRYRVGASLRGNEVLDLKASDYLDIIPGKGPVQAVLVVKNVFNRSKTAKP